MLSVWQMNYHGYKIYENCHYGISVRTDINIMWIYYNNMWMLCYIIGDYMIIVNAIVISNQNSIQLCCYLIQNDNYALYAT